MTTSVLTFTSGQYGLDGVVHCSVIEILNDQVRYGLKGAESLPIDESEYYMQDIEYHENLLLTLRPVEEVAGAVVIPAVNSMVSVTILEDPNDGM